MRASIRASRSYFFYAGLFSIVGNLLLLAHPMYTLQVYDRVLSSRSAETLVLLTVITLGLLMAMIVLDALRARLLLAIALGLERALGPQVVRGLLASARQSAGLPAAASLRDLTIIRSFLTGPGILALFDAPWAFVFTGLIFCFHPLLGSVAVSGALLLVALAWLNERLTRAPLTELNSCEGHAVRFMEVGMRNAEAIAALGMLAAVTERWVGLSQATGMASLRAGRYAGTMVAVIKLVRFAVQVVMFGMGAYLVISQQASAGAMLATTMMLGRALAPVELAVSTWKGFVEARGAYQRLAVLLHNAPLPASHVHLPPPQGQLTVERVLVVPRGSQQPILKGVSFALASGESLAIVGPSAAGKSVLARVLTGVWQPLSGGVRLDGADIGAWEPDRLGQHLGYLPQHVVLFAGTVGENIARLAQATSADIIAAAQRACAHDMIVRLPQGYDTEIGEGGALLSAGQRQRIGLARALFGNPRLVVLDEPSANLDGEGEAALFKVMQNLKALRVTQIIISHRPGLLSQVDKMLILRDGQVELFGSPREVLPRITRPGAQGVTALQPVLAAKEVSHG